jgi:GTPase Era involved in 16S rRNA processing
VNQADQASSLAPLTAAVPRVDPLVKAVDEYLSDMTWKIQYMARPGFDDLVDRFLKTTESSDQAAVVVVGQPSVGKSSVMNALLGNPIMRVSPDVSTTLYVTFVRSTTERVKVHSRDGSVNDITLGEVAIASSDNGSDAEWIEVELDDDRLDNLILIDTPGVGGLEATLDSAAVSALKTGSVLLFLTKVTTDLSDSEWKFLQVASERIDTVIFGLTQIDNDELGWTKKVEMTRQLLAERTSRFIDADVFGLSAHKADLARSAAEAGNASSEERYLEESGIPQLWSALIRIGARGDSVRQVNRVRAAISCLEVIQKAHHQLELSADPPEGLVQALERETGRLEALGGETKSWRRELELGIRSMQDVLSVRLKTGCDALLKDLEAHLNLNNGADAQPGIESVGTGLTVLVAEVEEDLKLEIENLCARITATLKGDDAAVDAAADLESRRFAEPVLGSYQPPDPKSMTTLERMTDVTTGYMGYNMSHLALITIVPMVSTVFAPVVATIGAIAFGFAWTKRYRHERGKLAQREQVEAWARGELANAQFDIERQLRNRLEDVHDFLHEQIGSLVERRLDEVRESVKRCHDALTKSKSELADEQEQLGSERLAIDDLISSGSSLLKTCRAAVEAESTGVAASS